MRVIVVGAGIGGLAVAVGLRQAASTFKSWSVLSACGLMAQDYRCSATDFVHLTPSASVNRCAQPPVLRLRPPVRDS